jgi:hypothetical protein
MSKLDRGDESNDCVKDVKPEETVIFADLDGWVYDTVGRLGVIASCGGWWLIY